MNEIEFYKKCPTKRCRTISGFSLPVSMIDKDENGRYSCPNCQKAKKLSRWEESTRSEYDGQGAMRKYDEFYKRKK